MNVDDDLQARTLLELAHMILKENDPAKLRELIAQRNELERNARNTENSTEARNRRLPADNNGSISSSSIPHQQQLDSCKEQSLASLRVDRSKLQNFAGLKRLGYHGKYYWDAVPVMIAFFCALIGSAGLFVCFMPPLPESSPADTLKDNRNQEITQSAHENIVTAPTEDLLLNSAVEIAANNLSQQTNFPVPSEGYREKHPKQQNLEVNFTRFYTGYSWKQANDKARWKFCELLAKTMNDKYQRAFKPEYFYNNLSALYATEEDSILKEDINDMIGLLVASGIGLQDHITSQ